MRLKAFAALLCVCFCCETTTCAEDLVVAAGQPAWKLSSDSVSLHVTRTGGHLGPVEFDRQSDDPIRPYYISPWQEEDLELPDVPVLVPLRGDFFCMPFGGNGEAYNGEQHPPHGEVAGSDWSFVSKKSSAGVNTLTLSLETKVRPGKVTKELNLVDGQNVIYSRHIITGFSGKTPLGHHSTLRVPERKGALKVQSSPFLFGMTNPVLFSDPVNREYQSLAIRHKFESLESIPTIWKDHPVADCTEFPDRTGFADLLSLFKQPSERGHPAWMIAINQDENYLWFSLKDVRVLPATVFWIENHGRHGVPWNGRNSCLGLEDVCAYFAEGIVPSVEKNPINTESIATSVALRADQPTEVRYIQGAVRTPIGFDEVEEVSFRPGRISILSPNGQVLTIPVKHEFLATGQLQ